MYLNCEQCGEQYWRKASAAKKSRYCSRECVSSAYKVRMRGSQNPNYKGDSKQACAGCGEIFATRERNRKFCSSVCYARYRRPSKQPQASKRPELSLVRSCGICGKGSLSGAAATCGHEECKRLYTEHRTTTTNLRNRRVCKNCGQQFSASPSKTKKYCSYQCHLDDGGAKRAGMAAALKTRKYGARKDANHNEIVRAFEKMGVPVLDLSNLGGGVPDLIVECQGALQLVDVKNPNTGYGKRGLNDLQTEWAENWRGGPVFLIYTVEDAADLANGKHENLTAVGGYRGANVA